MFWFLNFWFVCSKFRKAILNPNFFLEKFLLIGSHSLLKLLRCFHSSKLVLVPRTVAMSNNRCWSWSLMTKDETADSSNNSLFRPIVELPNFGGEIPTENCFSVHFMYAKKKKVRRRVSNGTQTNHNNIPTTMERQDYHSDVCEFIHDLP